MGGHENDAADEQNNRYTEAPLITLGRMGVRVFFFSIRVSSFPAKRLLQYPTAAVIRCVFLQTGNFLYLVFLAQWLH